MNNGARLDRQLPAQSLSRAEGIGRETASRRIRLVNPPTEISYASSSATPSEVARWNDKHDEIKSWKRAIPGRGENSDISYGSEVAARSATWTRSSGDGSGRATAPSNHFPPPMVAPQLERPSGPASRPSLPPQWKPPFPQAAETLRSLPPSRSQSRSPPAPLLAQVPSSIPSPADRYPMPRIPSKADKDLKLAPSTTSMQSVREAYFTSALELPLDLIAKVDQPVTRSTSGASDTISTGRLGSLLGKGRTGREGAHKEEMSSLTMPSQLLELGRGPSETEKDGSRHRKLAGWAARSRIVEAQPSSPPVAGTSEVLLEAAVTPDKGRDHSISKTPKSRHGTSPRQLWQSPRDQASPPPIPPKSKARSMRAEETGTQPFQVNTEHLTDNPATPPVSTSTRGQLDIPDSNLGAARAIPPTDTPGTLHPYIPPPRSVLERPTSPVDAVQQTHGKKYRDTLSSKYTARSERDTRTLPPFTTAHLTVTSRAEPGPLGSDEGLNHSGAAPTTFGIRNGLPVARHAAFTATPSQPSDASYPAGQPTQNILPISPPPSIFERGLADDSLVSIEVPSGNRGRLHLSFAWLADAAGRPRRRVPPPTAVILPPPVPPRSPSLQVNRGSSNTPARYISSRLPMVPDPPEGWHASDPFFSPARTSLDAPDLNHMHSLPINYPQPGLLYSRGNSYSHVPLPRSLNSPPRGPISIVSPSSVSASNARPIPSKPFLTENTPLPSTPYVGHTYPSHQRSPITWERFFEPRPGNRISVSQWRPDVLPQRSPTLVRPILRPLASRPISASRVGALGAPSGYQPGPSYWDRLFARKQGANVYRNSPGRPTYDVHPISTHMRKASVTPKRDIHEKRVQEEREAKGHGLKEERRRQKATKRDERERRRSRQSGRGDPSGRHLTRTNDTGRKFRGWVSRLGSALPDDR